MTAFSHVTLQCCICMHYSILLCRIYVFLFIQENTITIFIASRAYFLFQSLISSYYTTLSGSLSVLYWANSSWGSHHQEINYWYLAWPSLMITVLGPANHQYEISVLLISVLWSYQPLGQDIFSTNSSGFLYSIFTNISSILFFPQNSWTCLYSSCSFGWKIIHFEVNCF